MVDFIAGNVGTSKHRSGEKSFFLFDVPNKFFQKPTPNVQYKNKSELALPAILLKTLMHIGSIEIVVYT